MGVNDVELPQFTEPLIGEQAAPEIREQDNNNGTTDDSSADPWYPDEKMIKNIPVARTLTILVWAYNIVWGGIDFIVEYVCTTGMRAAFWSSLAVSSALVIYSTFCRTPMPLTYSFAKDQFLPPFWCFCYVMYQGTLAGIAFFVVILAALFMYVPFDEFWDWNCNDSGDDRDSRDGFRDKTLSPSFAPNGF